MDSREVGVWLEECLEAAATSEQPDQVSEESRQEHCRTRNALCGELSLLLREAVEMKWPFVPEKWQYREAVGSEDKTNLSDLISRNLPQLMALLRASILAWETSEALAVVFLVDRFLYWSDESQRLLGLTRLLHRRQRQAPLAPQLVIRQARVYLNSGKLQKAEFILSSLITNSGATGSWTYHSESDKLLVQAVCVQVRGLVLQKLGLWLEAAELIWASVIGYFALPQPDKKGIGTSLGVLANILVSMNDEDFEVLRSGPDIDLSLLGDCGHRLLSAAAAAQLAVVYSQYASLYVLTNVVAQGTCLLSYSFSPACAAAARHHFLLQAKQAFEIGLLTKTEHQPVASQQELHTFLKAAYCLAVVHRWLRPASETDLLRASLACQEGLALFYDYCEADGRARDGLAADVMRRVAQVKHALRVEPCPNSDEGSFIPDVYRQGVAGRPVRFTPARFLRLMERFQNYHESICESADAERHAKSCTGALCATALGTTVVPDCPPTEKASPPAAEDLPGGEEEGSEDGDVLGSSWHNVSSAGSPPGSVGGCGRGCGVHHGAANGRPAQASVGCCRPGLPTMHHTSSSSSISGSEAFEVVLEADVDTQVSEDEGPIGPLAARGAMSRLSLSSSFGSLGGSFSSSLGGSFGSKSSWERIHSSGSWASASGGPPPLAQLHPAAKRSVEELTETEDEATSSEELGATDRQPPSSVPDWEASGTSEGTPACCSCQDPGALVGPGPGEQYLLTEQDYRALLGGVCHDCLLKRLQSEETKFKLKEHNKAYSGLQLKFSRATGLWTARETCVYIGDDAKMEGKQRTALWVQFLHQEERLSRYMGKDYREPKEMQFHLKDVERQMTSQYYVTQFNKKLYEKKITAQIFFLPSDVLLILEAGKVVGCVTVEPYMLGDFVKLTNNTWKKNCAFPATEYGIAFGHFTYLFSQRQEVVVDLQGVVTANGKGLTYLTDPQIHSTKKPRGLSNFGERGLRYFLDQQHGPECNSVCKDLSLPPMERRPPI